MVIDWEIFLANLPLQPRFFWCKIRHGHICPKNQLPEQGYICARCGKIVVSKELYNERERPTRSS
jgi:hypothetical protein